MKFCWTTITVKNMAESLKFYQEIVGLPIIHQMAGGPGPELAFLGDGETQVELICHPSKTDVDIGPDISLGFVVSSLEDTMTFVKDHGIAIQAGPFQPNPFIRFFYVQDPNGLKIQFVENITEA
jgi:lactoylglutathione lyase